MERIFLIGYMGSGKTTIGKMLAARLGYSFVDMDAHIEQSQFKTVYQIFNEIGEAEFRKLEQKCLHEVAEFHNAVISTGGGAPCFFDNIEFMNSNGFTVYLKLTPTELAARLQFSKANKRPLIANKTGEELLTFVADGLAKRESYYNQAALHINGTEEEIVTGICKFL